MAQNPISLLLQRRLLTFSFPKTPTKPHHHFTLLNHFSAAAAAADQRRDLHDPPSAKPISLSARMSFVFDQVDAIEKQRSERHQTLTKIRAWRDKSNPIIENPPKPTNIIKKIDKPVAELDEGGGVSVADSAELGESDSNELRNERKNKKGEVELVHPWPEWIELMDRLVHQNYFDHRRSDEDKMVKDLGFEMLEEISNDEGVDFTDFKTVQSAFVNFGKDRFDILRSLSRKDIQILVGFGCPSTDKKAVFSSKLLRKHVHLDEGDVCSSCSLRNTCERGYLLTNKEDEARTIDIMRVLLSFGFDPVKGMVTNKSIMKQKSVKTVVRKLLHEIVKLSAVPIDPNLPPPIIRKPPPKVKQPPPTPKRRVGRDDVEMKKGDWLCAKCDFMNFAKNTKCLQCDAKRPKRQLLPGEWECPGCNFLNYRRNMACFHCDAKRPPDEFTEMKQQERQNGDKMGMDRRTASRPEVSNAWNFDFDDDESDGADVAAFEYADSPARDNEYPVDSQAQRGYSGGPEDDFNTARRARPHEREYSNLDHSKPGMGFDDFDDEDDDDVDSYEIDTQSKNVERKPYIDDFSEDEVFSESEQTRGRQSKFKHEKISLNKSDDDEMGFDSRKEPPAHPKWKSSHVADSRLRSRGRGAFGSDEELGLDSDDNDDFSSRRRKGSNFGTGRREFQRRTSNFKESSFSDSESDDEFPRSRRGDRSGRNKTEPGRRSKESGRDNNFVDRSNSRFGDRRKSSNSSDFDRPSRGPGHSNDRGFSGNDWKRNDSGGNGRFGDKRKSSNNDDFDRPSRGPGRSNDRRSSGNDWKKNDSGGNGRFGDRRKSSNSDGFDRPSRGSGRDDGRFLVNEWKKNDGGQHDINPKRERSRNTERTRSNEHDMDTDHNEYNNRRRFNKR